MEMYTQFQQDVDEFLRSYILGERNSNRFYEFSRKMNFFKSTKPKKANRDVVLSDIRGHMKVEQSEKIDSEIEQVLLDILTEMIEE